MAPLAAGMLVACHPGLTLYSVAKSHPLTFDALFFTLALVQTIRLHERPTFRRAIELGLGVGVGALSRATILSFLPLAGLWLLAVAPRRSRRVMVGHLVVAVMCSVAIVAPWTIRNSLLHGQFVFMLTSDAEVFWRGNNPNATGHSYIDAGRTVVSALSPAELDDLRRQPNELAQARWFATRSRAFIQQHPDAFVRLTLLKIFYFWWFAPQTGVLYERLWFLLYKAYYIGAVVLAFAGLWRVARSGAPATHFALVMVTFLIALSGLQSLYYVEGRHRWAIEPMVLVLSGGGVASLTPEFDCVVSNSMISYVHAESFSNRTSGAGGAGV